MVNNDANGLLDYYMLDFKQINGYQWKDRYFDYSLLEINEK